MAAFLLLMGISVNPGSSFGSAGAWGVTDGRVPQRKARCLGWKHMRLKT